jgi:predicted secreted protein with PEFG-CTERM motif
MTGMVTVTSGLQVLTNVGADAGDGTTTFNVEYEFNRVISSASVDEEQNSITFEIVGKVAGEDNHLTLMLPKNLISGPLVIWADGQQITNYEMTEEGEINKVKIPLNRETKLVSLVGTTVVPEFGAITMTVLAVGIFSLIAITFKTKKFLTLHEKI